VARDGVTVQATDGRELRLAGMVAANDLDGNEGTVRNAAQALARLVESEPGDVLLFRWRAHLPAKHTAILVSSDRVVHAHDGAAVAEVYLTPWWQRRLAYAFQFPARGGWTPRSVAVPATPPHAASAHATVGVVAALIEARTLTSRNGGRLEDRGGITDRGTVRRRSHGARGRNEPDSCTHQHRKHDGAHTIPPSHVG
jgi:hypothetical protein